ncbi:hypothetical protein [Hyalangium rubrum]|uniref:DUF5666 domain-containing protein n=1 Tax=Hyalangium rubrum TaxID=3103134 RepID=A0ABU5H4B2_9BACT|nr:hypothetical protein [Hyalangium sp. s54d21]MDY7227934.1 hypothetical protein [Hyalangium sp. s54d21]
MGRAYLGLWGVVLSAGPALAQEPPAEVRSLQEVQGAIASVDARRGTLMLSEGKGRVELRVDASTTIFLPGGIGSLADLTPGQKVRAAYERGDKGPVAQWIELVEEP